MPNSYVYFSPNLLVDVVKIEKEIKPFSTARSRLSGVSEDGILYSSFTDYIVDATYVPIFSVVSGEKISIYRKTPSQTYFEYLGTLGAGNFDFSDYNVINQQWYHYLATIAVDTSDPNIKDYLVYESKDSNGALIYTKIKWDSFSICAIEETDVDGIFSPVGDVWTFKGNLSMGAITQNRSVTVWNTLGKLPKAGVGVTNYATGTISCLLGNMKNISINRCVPDNYDSNGNKITNISYRSDELRYTERYNTTYEYSRENELYEKWLEFCADSRLKLLKDIKGNKWIVQIVDSPTNQINISSQEQMTTINFNWTQVEDDNIISIIKVLGEE